MTFFRQRPGGRRGRSWRTVRLPYGSGSPLCRRKPHCFGTIRGKPTIGAISATDEELWQALETAQAAEVVRGKALGLDEMLEQNGRNLSGGQKQRLTIARALEPKT